MALGSQSLFAVANQRRGTAMAASVQWLSEAVGWTGRRKLPVGLRRPLYGLFARAFAIDVDEADKPLQDYPSFSDFFARGLRAGAREVSAAPRVWTSPCDGRVMAMGTLGALPISAKGHDFSVDELLVDEDLVSRFRGGRFVTIYLSPRDYHGVHSPIATSITGYIYVPGALWPVSPFFSRRVQGIFSRNERVVITTEGPVAVVMVAAVGVGNMTLFGGAGRLESRSCRQQGIHKVEFTEPRAVARGDALGAFHLGSTVIVCMAPGFSDASLLSIGQTVRVGQVCASLAVGPG